MDLQSLIKIIQRELEIAQKIRDLVEQHERAMGSQKESIKANVETMQIQLKMLNSSIPTLLKEAEISKPLQGEVKEVKKLEPVTVTRMNAGERAKFVTDQETFESDMQLERETIRRKKKSLNERSKGGKEAKPSLYVKLANKLFSETSENLAKKGDFSGMKTDLIKAKMPFLLNTYLSVTFLTTLLLFLFSVVLFIVLLFVDVSLLAPYFTRYDGSILMRALKTFWIMLVIPLFTFIFMYLYPSLEKGYLGKKIDEELPFLTIHLSAIAGSKIEPTQIFRILAFSDEYIFTRKEMISLINKINVYGYNIASALRDSAKKSPSNRLRDLFNGMSTTITSGGDLEEFLNERSKSLLFEYRLDRERRNKVAETFMDIYISVVIAAPMILMLLLIIIKASGLGGINIGIGLLTFIILAAISLINIVFLIVLHLKQPKE